MNNGAAVLCFMGVGLLAGVVAQQGVSAYHDGVRPLLPEYRRGEITGSELSRRAWSMSAGFIAWFALPFTLVTTVATSHLLFLPPEILGLRHASRMLAAVIGAVSGAAVFGVVASTRAIYPHLPASVTANLPTIAAPVEHTLFLFPVAASYRQWGWRAAAPVSAVAVATVLAANELGRLPGGLSPAGLALLTGTAIIVVMAMRHRRASRSPVPRFLLDNVRSLRRKALLPLAAIGALCGALAQSRFLAGEPAAALLVGSGHIWDAAAVGVFSAVAFAPMVARSAATSSAYSTQGFPDWVLSAGMISGTSAVGAAGGAAVISAEILAAPQILALLHTFPKLAELGSAMRQGMTEVLDLTVLVGSVLSANAMIPNFGAAIVMTLFIWNEASQRRLMPVAVGPVGVLITALLTLLTARGG